MATQVKVGQLFRIHDTSPCHNLNLYYFYYFFLQVNLCIRFNLEYFGSKG